MKVGGAHGTLVPMEVGQVCDRTCGLCINSLYSLYRSVLYRTPVYVDVEGVRVLDV